MLRSGWTNDNKGHQSVVTFITLVLEDKSSQELEDGSNPLGTDHPIEFLK